MPVKQHDPAPITLKPTVVLGITGALGPPGLPGPEGSSLAIGTTGPRGMTGPVGDFGATGSNAGTGPTGPRGATGPPEVIELGPTGWWGDWGDEGPTGITGFAGRTGVPGNAGGPAGITGTVGPTGAGSYGGLQAPIFAASEVYLTPTYLNRFNVDWTGKLEYYQVSNGVIILVPVFVPFPRSFTELVVDSYQERSFGVFFRMALYDCDVNMHPTVPLIQSPDIIPGGQGRIGFSFSSLALQAKPYYFAFLSNTYGVYYRAMASYQPAPVLGWRKYADNTQWMFEAVQMKYSNFNYGYNQGFINLTAMTTPDLDFASGAVLLMGMR